MKRILLASLLLTSAAAQAIIYRHDVAEEKHRQLGAQPQFDCVGKVLNAENQAAAGSCVLIGDRYVLTAAHLFVKSDIKHDTMMHNGRQMIMHTQTNRRMDDISHYDFRFNRIRYRGKLMKVLPAYMDSATNGQCDIALIELEEPVTNCKPATLCTSFDELRSIATLVGYGVSGNASKPEEVDEYGYKLAGENTIDTLQGYQYSDKPALLGFDFDHPEKPQYNHMGNTKPLAMEGFCGGGDSGGGMLRQRKDGSWELIGICSGGGTNIDNLFTIGYYCNTGQYTRVSVFQDWIKQGITDFEKKRVAESK
jgi:Trypsin.